MFQIHISGKLSKLSKLFAQHLEPAIPLDSTALQWYGHATRIAGHDCVILMELQSRYAMVFCGDCLDYTDQFPDVFQDRLWREVCVITQLDKHLPDPEISLLSDIALDLSSNQYFQKGSDPSVMAHISLVADHLRFLVEEEGYPMPEDGADSVSFGIRANDFPRKRKGDKDFFIPLDVFRDFWLGLIHAVKDKPAKKRKPAKLAESENNVIQVDFKKRKVSPR